MPSHRPQPSRRPHPSAILLPRPSKRRGALWETDHVTVYRHGSRRAFALGEVEQLSANPNGCPPRWSACVVFVPMLTEVKRLLRALDTYKRANARRADLNQSPIVSPFSFCVTHCALDGTVERYVYQHAQVYESELRDGMFIVRFTSPTRAILA